MVFRAGLPSNVRLCFGQPCSPCESGRFRRPSPRSAYTYTPSGASPAVIVSLSKVPPGSALRNCGFVPKPCFCGLSARPSASPLKTLCVFRRLTGPDRDRAWHPRELGQGNACSSLASGKSSTPPARCIHHSRHDASSAGYRLLASFAPGVASREPESRRSPALAPRTRRLAPTFHKARFFFVASALADVPSARLTAGDRLHGTIVQGLFARCCWLARRICRGVVCSRR